MSKVFFDKVAEVFPIALNRMVGYKLDEIKKIEKLYGISIRGEFESFLLRAGRCDGGVIGDDPIVIYNPLKDVRTHILFQANFFNDLQGIGAWEYLHMPFVFSLESETQYYFLQTGLQGNEYVYHYNENSEIIHNTGMSFSDYLIDITDRYPLGRTICRGELLIISSDG